MAIAAEIIDIKIVNIRIKESWSDRKCTFKFTGNHRRAGGVVAIWRESDRDFGNVGTGSGKAFSIRGFGEEDGRMRSPKGTITISELLKAVNYPREKSLKISFPTNSQSMTFLTGNRQQGTA